MPNFESSMCKTFGVDDPTFMFYIGGHASKVPSFHRMTHGDEDKSSPCPPQDGSNLAPRGAVLSHTESLVQSCYRCLSLISEAFSSQPTRTRKKSA